MRGFTLIELILVIAIISIIALLSAPFYSRFLLQNAVDNTVDQLVGSLRKAQIYSMTGKKGSSWSVNFSSNTLTLYKGAPPFASRAEPGLDETFSVNPNVSIAGMTDMTYARSTGLPTGAATIIISSGNNSETITVNSEGMVSK